MKQITKRQLDRQGNKDKLKEWLPFELVVDGEVIAVMILPSAQAKYDGSQAVNKELKFSKANQAKGRMLTL